MITAVGEEETRYITMGYITIPKALMGSTYSAISPTAKLLY